LAALLNALPQIFSYSLREHNGFTVADVTKVLKKMITLDSVHGIQKVLEVLLK